MGLSSFEMHRRRVALQETLRRAAERDAFVAGIHDAGIGPEIAGKLYDAGFRSRYDLAGSTPEELMEIEGMGETRTEALLKWARLRAEAVPEAESPLAAEVEAVEPEIEPEPDWDSMLISALDEYQEEHYPDVEGYGGTKSKKIKILRREWENEHAKGGE